MADQPLIEQIDRFLEATGMAESAFGRAAMNDWAFVRDIRAGRDLRRSTEARVIEFMNSHPSMAEQAAA